MTPSRSTSPEAGCPEIALIATDLDGTLLDPAGEVTARTRGALRAARGAGIVVVAATGRTHRSARRLLADAPVDYIVSSNGAIIWDTDAETITLARTIDPPTADRTIGALRASLEEAALGWETLDGCGFDRAFRAGGYSLDELRLARVPEPDGRTAVVKLFLGHHDVRSGDDAMTDLAPLVPPELNVSTSGAPFLEITAPAVDKATTLAILCDQFGLDATQVIAFGDQINDLPMLRWAGISVAMANAHADVAPDCDETTEDNASDGVARRVESLLAPDA